MFQIPHLIKRISEELKAQGGQAYLVGGAVRDQILGLQPKDFDLEVFNLPTETVAQVLRQFAPVEEVGKAFGVYKIRFGDNELDVGLPRTETKTAPGHKGFAIKADSNLDLESAARRRDFTINAIYLDPLILEVKDPFHGQEDLQNKILRVVDPKTFSEDPLRAMRALQFVARFNLIIEPDTAALIRTMLPSLNELPAERVWEEWKKMLLKAEAPSQGLKAGFELGIIPYLYPYLAKMAETPQDPEWHPEGDVWVHTMLVLDQAAQIVRREKLDSKNSLTVLLGALCHDSGKPETTTESGGHIHSFEHDKFGAEITKQFLTKLNVDNLTLGKVVKIVAEHMNPSALYHQVKSGQVVSDAAIRRLATRLHPATIKELVWVCEADFRGRGEPTGEFQSGQWLLARAHDLEVAEAKPKNVVEGRDLIGLGFKPGPYFGKLIKIANNLRDKNKTREEILEELKKYK